MVVLKVILLLCLLAGLSGSLKSTIVTTRWARAPDKSDWSRKDQLWTAIRGGVLSAITVAGIVPVIRRIL